MKFFFRLICVSTLLLPGIIVSNTWAADVLIQGFEDIKQVRQWKARRDKWDEPKNDGSLYNTLHPDRNWKTQGMYSLRLEFKKFQPGQPQWPGISMLSSKGDYKITDWSKYGEIAMDIRNVCDEKVRVSIELRSKLEKNGHTEFIFVPPHTSVTFRISLKKVWKETAHNIDIRDIQKIIIYSCRPSGPWKYCIDNIRLLDNHGQRDLQENFNRVALTIRAISDAGTREKFSKQLVALKKQPAAKPDSVEVLREKFQILLRDVEGSLYKPERRYNFGPAGQDKTPGWFDTGSKAYSPTQGFGWMKDKASLRLFRNEYYKGWKRSKSEHWAILKRPPVYLNSQQKGIVSSYGERTFRIDLPNGEYRVMAIIGYPGGLNMCPIDMTVNINDVDKHRVTLPNHHIYRTPVWKAKVTDGKLELAFSANNKRQWLINAISIWPEADHKRAMAEVVEFLREDIHILPAELRAKWEDCRPIITPRKNVPRQFEESGLAVFLTNSLTNYLSDFTPEKYGVPGGLKFWSARNEIATTSFGLLPLGNAGETINIKCTDLTSESGREKISALAVRVEMVRNIAWPMLKNQRKDIIEKPRILDRGLAGAFTIKPWQARQGFVMVDLTGKEKPGKYSGKITLQTVKLKKITLPILLHVKPITLKADPRLCYGAYWYWYTEKKLPRIQAELADMRAHGFNMIGPHGTGPSIMPGEIKNGKVVWKISGEKKTKRMIKLARELGFKPGPYAFAGCLNALSKKMHDRVLRKCPYDFGLKQEFYDHLTDLTRVIIEWDKKHGWGEILLYPLDEICDSKLAYKIALAIKRVPEAKLYNNSVPLIQSKLGVLVDVAGYAYRCDETELREIIRSKPATKAWAYPNCTVKSHRVWGRMFWGLSGLKTGLTGLWPWAYQSPSGSYDTPFDGVYPDALLAYPSIETPLSTVQYEAIRQGIDDGKYLYTLQNLIARVKAKRDPACWAAAGQAELALATVMDNVPINYKTTDANQWSQSQQENTRKALADAIIKLQNKLGKISGR